jgi:uncharacterized protein (TIGR02246 family)
MDDLAQTVARFCDAWNRHDAAALAAMWTEDGELNHPWGVRAVGRDAIRELLEEEHSASMAVSQLSVVGVTSRESGRAVTAEIDGVLTSVLGPNGRSYDLRHRLYAMFVGGAGHGTDWQIRTMSPVANPRA